MTHRNGVRLFVAMLVLASLTCNLPSQEPEPTEAPSVTPEPTVFVPTEPPEPTPAPDPRVVIHQGDVFQIYQLDGSLVETRSAAGLADWAHPNQTQIVGDAIYYVDSGGNSLGGMVRRSLPGGLEDLAFTAIADTSILKFAVTPDENMIAWASGEWASSSLWYSDLAGADQQLITQSDPSLGLEDFYVLETYRWTPSGDLYFTWQISGIGNLLYFGYSSMYRYRPSSGEILALAEAPPGGGMPCWHLVSADDVNLVGVCAAEGDAPGLRELDWSVGTENVLPLLPDQDQTGAAQYSPSGGRLAYAFARGGMADVDGYIAVRLTPADAPVVIASMIDGYFHRLEWVDEERLVAGGTQADLSQVYLLLLDGTLSPIGAGALIGLIQP